MDTATCYLHFSETIPYTEPWVDENLAPIILARTREELVHSALPASGGHATHDAFLRAGDEAHAPALGGAKIRAG